MDDCGRCLLSVPVLWSGETELDHFRDHFVFDFCRVESGGSSTVGFVVGGFEIVIVHRVIGS